jgi:hypothetical protein
MLRGGVWVKRVRKGGERKGVSLNRAVRVVDPTGEEEFGFGKEILRGPRESRREALRNLGAEGLLYGDLEGFDYSANLFY